MTTQMSKDATSITPIAIPQSSRLRVVLCGSMAALPMMEQLRNILVAQGIEAIAPNPDVLGDITDGEEFRAVKRDASRRHMSLIQDPSTAAILVVNVERHGMANYVGPNAFGEIAVAFAESRETFLLNEIPPGYKDELEAWGARPLHGDLKPLIEHFRAGATCVGVGRSTSTASTTINASAPTSAAPSDPTNAGCAGA